jgi:carbamoyl-phosphate synthase large subunit
MASPGHPVLIDKFLEEAVEVDVDALCDGRDTIIGGIMEHIEAAGVHSGDSACVLPPHSIEPGMIAQIKRATRAMAAELSVIGLMNVQYAIKDDQLYIIEVNPRASRTVPFVSKATGVPLAKFATKVMLGRSLVDLGLTEDRVPDYVSVKEAVLPFDRFPGVDTLLGPEMKSTGEVMGMGVDFGIAYAKAQLGAGQNLPKTGCVFISVSERDKPAMLAVVRQFGEIGFTIMATGGTHAYLKDHGMQSTLINKVSQGRPHVADAIRNGAIQLVINTGSGDEPRNDGYTIRRAALKFKIPYATTIAGAKAVCRGVTALRKGALEVKAVQAYHEDRSSAKGETN